jgi:multidrug efflux pump subunit AcrA (membrane-fusion protein)
LKIITFRFPRSFQHLELEMNIFTQPCLLSHFLYVRKMKNMKQSYKTFTFIILQITFILAWSLSSCKPDLERNEQKFKNINEIDTIQAPTIIINKRDTVFSRPLKVNYTYTQLTKIQIPVAGKLEKGNVELKKGTKFKKNELLCFINTAEPFLKLRESKLQFMNQYEALCIQASQENTQKLAETKAFFQKLQKPTKLPALIEFINLNQEQNLTIKEAYQSLEILEAEIQKHFYLAPFDGEIVKLNKRANQQIKTNETIAECIQNKETITLNFLLPDSLFESQYTNTLLIGQVSIAIPQKQVSSKHLSETLVSIPNLNNNLILIIQKEGVTLKTEFKP